MSLRKMGRPHGLRGSTSPDERSAKNLGRVKEVQQERQWTPVPVYSRQQREALVREWREQRKQRTAEIRKQREQQRIWYPVQAIQGGIGE